MESKFVTGNGSSETHAKKIRDKDTGELKDNPHFKRGEDYDTLCFTEVVEMVAKPTRRPKNHAQWAIFSTYNKYDAREFSVQREHGEFVVLPVDLDKKVPHIEDVKKAITKALFDLLEDEGLTCDRALERTGQIIFLPNRGDHYEFHINA